MLSTHAIRRRLASLGQLAMEMLEEEPTAESPPPVASALPPLEHLRHAIAASRATDATAPNPRVYSELRLLLNQLESGRVSSEPTRELTTITAPAPVQRGLGALLRRKAQSAVRRVVRRF